MTPAKIYLICSGAAGLIILIFFIFRLKKAFEGLHSIINDTLKRPDKDGVWRWSRTSLTMFSGWVIAIYMALFDLVKKGFHYEVFLAFVGIALGAKVTDAISKKWDPLVQPPKDEPTKN